MSSVTNPKWLYEDKGHGVNGSTGFFEELNHKCYSLTKNEDYQKDDDLKKTESINRDNWRLAYFWLP